MSAGVRADPALKRAPLPGTPAALGGTEAPVVRAAPAGSLPFLLEGERVAVTGTERGGAAAFRIVGTLVASALRTDAGPAANVVVGPATLRRELHGGRGSVIEHLLALPALPLVAAQWSAPPGAPELPGLVLEITLLPGAAAVRYRVDGDGVRAVEEGSEHGVDVTVHPTPEEWSAVEEEGGGVRARARVRGAPRVTLLLAAGTPREIERALAAAPHLAAHEIRAAASADPGKVDTLVVRSGVPEIDDAVLWATTRVQGAVRRTGSAEPEAIFWTGVGALACGDFAVGRSAVGRLDEAEAGGPLTTLLAARHALASGDQAAALERLAALPPERLAELRGAGPEAWRGWPAALSTLADALRHATAESDLDALRAEAAREPAAAGGGLRLPMAGADTAHGRSWPGYLLGGAGAPRPRARPDGGAPEALAAWTAFAAGRSEEAWTSWRRTLSAGMAGGAGGRGAWDRGPGEGEAAAPGAGVLLATLVHGLLGIAPDAPAGRLRVAPVLPVHLRSFEVRNLRVAEARIGMEYRREGGAHLFRLEPVGGRVPVMAVLEPSLPFRPERVRVDGAHADLERSAEGVRTRIAVQLPLDATRTLEVGES